MKKSEIKLVVLELLTLIILMLNIFVKNILNEYMLCLLIGMDLGISIFLVGFEKNKTLEKSKIVHSVTIFTLAFLILIYGIGLFTGYVHTPYSLKPINIIKNILPVLILIILSELFRTNLCCKGANNKYIKILTIILFTAVDVSLAIHMYDLKEMSRVLELSTLVVVPSIFKNIMLTDFSYHYGYEPCLMYHCIIGLYQYIIPIQPALDVYLESVIMFLLPVIMKTLINSRYRKEKKKKEDIRDKHTSSKIVTAAFSVIILIVICLFSNLFPLWIAVVGSGSMTPTINIGDMVIVDKRVSKNIDELKTGDVLVFKMKKRIYVHRVMEIEKKDNDYAIKTKGDRKENAVDSWTVTKKDVVGRVKFKIPCIGYPTVWLNRIMEGSKK